MPRGDRDLRVTGLEDLTSLRRDAKITPQQGLGRGGSQTHERCRPQAAEFCFEPWLAGTDFAAAWLLMQPAFAALDELEMLGLIQRRDRNAGQGECPPLPGPPAAPGHASVAVFDAGAALVPMRGRADSLNLAIATGVLLYDLWRRRGYDGARA